MINNDRLKIISKRIITNGLNKKREDSFDIFKVKINSSFEKISKIKNLELLSYGDLIYFNSFTFYLIEGFYEFNIDIDSNEIERTKEIDLKISIKKIKNHIIKDLNFREKDLNLMYEFIYSYIKFFAKKEMIQ